MPSELATAYMAIRASKDKLVPDLENIRNEVKSKLSSVATITLGVIGAEALTAAIKSPINALLTSIQTARTAYQSQLKLAAILAATGNAAGYTVPELKAMAGEIAKITNYTKGEIVAAESMLATFKNIRGDIFSGAIKGASDLAAAMGIDLESATRRLGRALENPEHGMMALSRVGVTFTQQQRALVQSLQSSGDLIGAQNVILDTLAGKYGGVAEAMQDPITQLGKLVKSQMTLVGATILPYVQALATEMCGVAESASEMTQGLNKAAPSTTTLGKTIAVVADVVEGLNIAFSYLGITVGQFLVTTINGFCSIAEWLSNVTGIMEPGTEGLRAFTKETEQGIAQWQQELNDTLVGPSFSERFMKDADASQAKIDELQRKAANASPGAIDSVNENFEKLDDTLEKAKEKLAFEEATEGMGKYAKQVAEATQQVHELVAAHQIPQTPEEQALAFKQEAAGLNSKSIQETIKLATPDGQAQAFSDEAQGMNNHSIEQALQRGRDANRIDEMKKQAEEMQRKAEELDAAEERRKKLKEDKQKAEQFTERNKNPLEKFRDELKEYKRLAKDGLLDQSVVNRFEKEGFAKAQEDQFGKLEKPRAGFSDLTETIQKIQLALLNPDQDHQRKIAQSTDVMAKALAAGGSVEQKLDRMITAIKEQKGVGE